LRCISLKNLDPHHAPRPSAHFRTSQKRESAFQYLISQIGRRGANEEAQSTFREHRHPVLP
jgi:hypothetical protein